MKKAIFVLALAGLLMVCAVGTATAKNKFEKEVDIEQVAAKLARETQRGDYQLVTAAELKQWIDQGKSMVIVDTMPYASSYKKAHVPGARQFLMPVAQMTRWDAGQTGHKSEADFKAVLGPDTAKTVVVYCGFVKCGRSHNGAMWAKKLGYKNVYRFSGGIFAWKGAGYPVEKVK